MEQYIFLCFKIYDNVKLYIYVYFIRYVLLRVGKQNSQSFTINFLCYRTHSWCSNTVSHILPEVKAVNEKN